MKASQALEVGSTPIARSSENTAPSERWCFFVCDIRFSFILSLPVPADTAPIHRQGHQSSRVPHRSASPTSPFFSLLCKTDRVAHITRLLFCGRFDRMNLPINLLHKVICRHRTVDVTKKRLDGCVDFASLCPHAPHPTRAPRSGTPASR